MKVVSLVFGSLVFVAFSSAQYFSEGWKPGQPAYGTVEAGPASTPSAEQPGGVHVPTGNGGSFDFSKLLTSGPVGSLLAKAGVNLSAAANGTQELLWDPRVPLITDDNYEEMIVQETLTPEEEERRTWFIVISTTLGQQAQGGISRLVDKQFDQVYNMSVVEGDLPDVRFGRIDYLNVTYLTTKWNIWSGPWLVVSRDRGQSLRFFNARHIRVNSTVMHNFLKEEIWRNTEPWSSPFAPGGGREFILHYIALGMKKVYDVIVRIPKFLLMIATGAFGSLVMRLLHRGEPPKQSQPQAKVPIEHKAAMVTSAQATPTSSPTKKASGKTKKSGKK